MTLSPRSISLMGVGTKPRVCAALGLWNDAMEVEITPPQQPPPLHKGYVIVRGRRIISISSDSLHVRVINA